MHRIIKPSVSVFFADVQPPSISCWTDLSLLQMYIFRSSTRLSHLINTISIRPHVLLTSGIWCSIIRVDHLGCCSHDWRHGRLQTIEFAAYRQSDCPFGCIVLLVRHSLIIIALQLTWVLKPYHCLASSIYYPILGMCSVTETSARSTVWHGN